MPYVCLVSAQERLELEGTEVDCLPKAHLELENAAAAQTVTVVSSIPLLFLFFSLSLLVFFLREH